MQVQRVQNNNYSNSPYFKGKITLLNSRIILRSQDVLKFLILYNHQYHLHIDFSYCSPLVKFILNSNF